MIQHSRQPSRSALRDGLTRAAAGLPWFRSMVLRLSVALAMIVGAGLTPALAADRFIPLGEAADAPQGFIDMCQRDSVLCFAGLAPHASRVAAGQVHAAGTFPARLRLSYAMLTPIGSIRGRIVSDRVAQPDAALLDTLPSDTPDPQAEAGLRHLAVTINTEVNRHVFQFSDRATTGLTEFWDRPRHINRRQLAGDCEDIAIEKRMELVAAGFPPERLTYAVVFDPPFGLHAVLLVRLAQGDMVLDSHNNWMIPWSETRYGWVRIQAWGNPLEWHLPNGI